MMNHTKVIQILKNVSEYDNQQILNILKEERIGLHYGLLQDGNILCYGRSSLNSKPNLVKEITKLEFEALETLNFLSEEIKEKVLAFMLIPICPSCGVSLIENPISLRGDIGYRFNPTTKEFEIDYASTDRNEYPFCSSCWEEIEIDIPFEYHKVIFKKDEQEHLQIKEEFMK